MRRGPAVICLVAMWLSAACVGLSDAPATSNPVPPTTPTSAADATPDVTPSDDVSSSAPDETPAETPLETPLASASGFPSIAAACTGTDANREFFATVATKVDWDVYCAVLPKGWSVDTGSYRTAGGGWLKIAYKASGGRRFELREGAFCTDPATCLPTGVEIAPGPFGDREATVLQVEDGGYAMIVDQGQPLMWAAIGKGMDETTFRNYAEALSLVADY
jgi:hypothetical protein